MPALEAVSWSSTSRSTRSPWPRWSSGPARRSARCFSELAAEYDAAGRGFELRAVAGGWRLYTRAACAPYVERFVREGQPAKISQAALETLAVVAYRQPTTRSRIAAVRGVNVDAVMRTLLTRGLSPRSASNGSPARSSTPPPITSSTGSG